MSFRSRNLICLSFFHVCLQCSMRDLHTDVNSSQSFWRHQQISLYIKGTWRCSNVISETLVRKWYDIFFLRFCLFLCLFLWRIWIYIKSFAETNKTILRHFLSNRNGFKLCLINFFLNMKMRETRF